MFLKHLRCFTLFSGLLLATAFGVKAQPCADTQPVITGSQVVSNSQNGVIYSTPNIPGHTYTWTISNGTITSGAGTNQVTVTWGSVGSGTLTVQETNPLVPCSTSVSKTVSVQPLLISYFYYTNTSCYGDNITFHDASVADAVYPITNYSWDFGDGNTSTAQNPVHQYLPPYMTTWTVTLIVTNSIGYRDTIYDAVYVNPNQFIPTAEFSSAIPNCLYTPVPFNSSASTTPAGTGNIIHWDWNFGDPASGSSNIYSTGTGPLATHVFSGPGTYTVTLEVTNERYCKGSITHQVVITPSVPSASYTFSNPTCLGNPVYFTDGSSTPTGHPLTNWEWNFGDGSILNTNQNSTHVFPGLGPYTVQLKVTNDLGCVDSLRKTVKLDPSPLSNFVWDSKCFGDTIKFENKTTLNNGPPISTYYWDFGDPTSGFNNSSAINPRHVFTAPGTYTVTLVSTNTSGCPDSIQRDLTMFPPPSCEYTWQYGSINQQINFHIDSSSTNIGAIGNMVLWDFGDGNYGYGWNPSHIYPAGGTFDVTLTVTDTIGCSNTVMHQIFIPALPMAFFSSNSPVCYGNQPVCFTDLSNAATPPFGYITTWIWNYGDGSPKDTIQFPNDPNHCHTYATADTFAVQLQVFDNYGFSDSITINILVIPDPVANFYYSSTLCPDQLVQFTDASFANGGGNIISWKWNFADPGSGSNNVSNIQNPSHIFTAGDSTYMVKLIVQNFNGCTDTIIKPVYIYPKPPVEFTYDTACLNQLVHFTVDTNVTYVDSIASWAWNFGDGSPISTDPQATSHMFAAVGTYTVTLMITDIHGCTNTVSHTIEVNPLPVAQFSYSSPACHGSAVQFTDASYVNAIFAGYVAKWHWDFGDGNTQTVVIPNSPNVLHSYTGPTLTYNVTLTVWTNDSCSTSITKTVNLIPSPIANFDTSTVRCKNQPVQFTDLSQTNGGGSIVTWSWNFGEPASGVNNFSPLQNPTHSYMSTGTFTVTLVVTNANNCRDTVQKTININDLPIANFTADTVCFGTATSFSDMSNANPGTIVSYAWNFGDGSPINVQPNPTHTYANYGVFTVTLTVGNSNGCSNSITKQVLVNPLPTAAYTFTTPNCQGTPVCFTDMSTTPPGYLGNIIQWDWDFGDGGTQTVYFPANPNVCHTFLGAALTHVVRLTVMTSDSCTHFIEHTVNSVPSPVANFSSSTTTCAGQTVNFTDLSQLNGGGPIISWSWNFGEPSSGINNFSTLQNPSHSYATANTFNVTLIINNASNCPDTIVKTVTINQLPIASFTADTVCFGDATSFNSSASIPNAFSIVSYSWNFGDGSPVNTQPNPTHTYANYGLFTVTLTITNSNGCVGTATKQILVRPLPIPEFTFTTPSCQGSAVQFTNLSTTVPGFMGTINQWVWDFGDGSTPVTVNFPNNPNVTHIFSGTALNHLVRLTITTLDGCTDFIEHNVASVPAPIANFGYQTQNCQGQSVPFNDISQMNGGGPIISWNWNFGDPGSGGNNTSNTQNPVHVFSTSVGSPFTVTLIVNNSSGCADTVTHQVSVNPKPVANFTADTACLTHTTTFQSTSTTTVGSIATYAWNFGDGGTSTQQNPTHLYANAATYTVTLVVTTDAGCTKDTSKQVVVHPNPVAAFTFSSPSCMGDSVQFTNLSTTPGSAIKRWIWDFNDGQTVNILFPNSPNVKHAFANAGTYNVKLTVKTSDSCEHFTILPVTIQQRPAANFDFAATRCEMMPVQFSDLSQSTGGVPVVAWEWDFGDPNSGTLNNSTIQNPSHSFTAGGQTYTVVLTVHNANGCTDTISKDVSVNDAPVAEFTADTACVGSTTQFTDGSTAGSGTLSTWAWNFGDPASGSGNTSTQQNPTHTYNAPGSYTVTLVVTNSNSCQHDTSMVVNVNPKPDAMFEYTSTCIGDSTHFTDLSIAPGSQVVSWTWNFGDGGTSTQQNPWHTFTTSGTFQVTLTITNLAGCADSVTIPVVARPKPTADFVYTNFYCPAGQVNFQDQSTGTAAAIVGRLWIFEPGYTSTNVNPTYTFGMTDTTYVVSLIVTDTYGCTDTINDSVYVKPGFDFTFNFDTVCFGQPMHFTPVNMALGDTLYSPRWEFGDPNSGPSNKSNLYSPTHVFTQPGQYVVKFRANNSDNCVDSIYRTVIVHGLPEPYFKATIPQCDSIAAFADSSFAGEGSIAQWIWNFGDGSPLQTITTPPGNTTHQYNTIGVPYNATLTIVNSYGCSDSVSHEVTRYQCVLANYSYMDTLRCARYPIAFTDSSTPNNKITQWHWTFGDGTDTTYTTFSNSIVHTYQNAGTYTVSLNIAATVNSMGFNDTKIKTIVIHPTSIPYFSNPGVCLNQVTLFADTSNTFGAGTSKWWWNFGDLGSASNTDTVKFPTHKYDTAGIYDVKMIVMNKYGCKDSLTKPTRVFNIPAAHFNNTVACSGNPTYFTDASIIGDTTMAQWHWNFGVQGSLRDTADIQDPIYKYKTAGDYTVRMIVQDNFGCYDTIDSLVTVNVTPVSAFTYTNNVNGMTGKIQLNNLSTGATLYDWDFGNGQTSTEENPMATYSMDGTYVIKLISTNQFNCTDTVFYEYQVLFKGLYVPNAFAPTSTNLSIRLFKPVGTNLKQYDIQVYDSWGHLLWESNKLDTDGRPLEGWDGTFNGNMMPVGTYMWKASATFIDDTIWQGSDIGTGSKSTMGTVSLIR